MLQQIYIYIHIYLFKKHSGSPLKSREAITWRTIRTAGPLKGKGSLRAEAYRSIFLSMPRFMPKFDVRRCSGVKISPNQGAVKAATPMLLTMFCMHTLRTYVYLYLQHVYICVKCTCIYYHVYSYFHIQPSASAANSSSPHQSNHLHCPLSWHGGYMGIYGDIPRYRISRMVLAQYVLALRGDSALCSRHLQYI